MHALSLPLAPVADPGVQDDPAPAPFNVPLTLFAINGAGLVEAFHGFHDGEHWRAYDLPGRGDWQVLAWKAGYAALRSAPHRALRGATPAAEGMRLLPACVLQP